MIDVRETATGNRYQLVSKQSMFYWAQHTRKIIRHRNAWHTLHKLLPFYSNETTLRSGICYRKSVCLSVTFVHPTQPVEMFGNVSTPFRILAIGWPPCKISRRSSHGTLPTGVKRKSGSHASKRCWTCQRLYHSIHNKTASGSVYIYRRKYVNVTFGYSHLVISFLFSHRPTRFCYHFLERLS